MKHLKVIILGLMFFSEPILRADEPQAAPAECPATGQPLPDTTISDEELARLFHVLATQQPKCPQELVIEPKYSKPNRAAASLMVACVVGVFISFLQSNYKFNRGNPLGDYVPVDFYPKLALGSIAGCSGFMVWQVTKLINKISARNKRIALEYSKKVLEKVIIQEHVDDARVLELARDIGQEAAMRVANQALEQIQEAIEFLQASPMDADPTSIKAELASFELQRSTVERRIAAIKQL
jgi:hypothetical protein